MGGNKKEKNMKNYLKEACVSTIRMMLQSLAVRVVKSKLVLIKSFSFPLENVWIQIILKSLSRS